MKFTTDQLKVIEQRHADILVSAAAGSGKTAVLVERIIQLISDEVSPIDIDRVLVVTFTNAAASEMKDRIGKAIERKIAEYPMNKHLYKQRILLEGAFITTIHGFCNRLIKMHFDVLGVSPDMRILNDHENKILIQTAIDYTFEQAYLTKDAGFLALMDAYCDGKNDDFMKELVIDLYHNAMSQPHPHQWLDFCAQLYIDLSETHPLFKLMEQRVNTIINGINIVYSEMIDQISLELDAKEKVVIALEEEYQRFTMLQNQLGQMDLKGLFQLFDGELFVSRLTFPRNFENIEMKEWIQNQRKQIKEYIKTFQGKYFSKSFEIEWEQLSSQAPHIQSLVTLVKAFSKDFQRLKLEQEGMDFNDIEHFAIQLLVDETGVPTETATIYQDFFYEIMIDEYQDSNLVQESLLQAISKAHLGQPNVFMVGDVKQSIYKFRMAKPSLFLSKYKMFGTQGDRVRIDLSKNFRSRPEILDFANQLFGDIMHENTGEIDYDDQQALHLGGAYEPDGDKIVEIHLFEAKSYEEQPLSKQEIEMQFIVDQIKAITHPVSGMKIIDKQTGKARIAKYEDIAILYRSVASKVGPLKEIFKNVGIPLEHSSDEGYFNTVEIQNMIQLLKIIDNPRQDIPLVAVLRSELFLFTDDELVEIRGFAQKTEFYEAMRIASQSASVIAHKTSEALELLQSFRAQSIKSSVLELLLYIFEKTGYEMYLMSQPNNHVSMGNIQLLKAIAKEFDTKLGNNLYQFIKHIEKVEKNALDYGEAKGEHSKQIGVRLMTIHKSKGLEYPIVFLGNCGGQFNLKELKNPIIYHQELGFGLKYVNLEKRYTMRTSFYEMIKNKSQSELISEEMRVLYVAITRAKEKLFIVGTINEADKTIKQFQMYGNGFKGIIAEEKIQNTKRYIDWILMSLFAHGFSQLSNQSQNGLQVYLHQNEVLNEEYPLGVQEATSEMVADKQFIDVEAFSSNPYFDYHYPYEKDTKLPSRISVSDLKENHVKTSFIERLSDTDKIHQKGKGLEIGDAMHHFLRYVNLSTLDTSNVRKHILELTEQGFLTLEESKLIQEKTIQTFVQSDIFEQMKKADALQLLYREQPFVAQLDISKWVSGDEDLRYIQGIIDAFILTDQGIILIDYKTDRISLAHSGQLIKKYKLQLDIYKHALQLIWQQPVIATIIYSLHLNKALEVME